MMHGRPRQRSADPAADAEAEAKAKLFESLLARVFKDHQERNYTKEALEQNARLVQLNPDLYTAWNFRKLAVKHLLEAEPDEESRRLLIREELKVNENALKAHIKSYVTWHHRKWLLGLGLSSLDYEFELLKQLFKLDGRNFHGWGYRRFIARLKGHPLQEELDYTMTLLNQNFSNYSAWHNRSVLLLELFKEKEEEEKERILSDEFELIKQALYTDPGDQSGWFYHSWLLGHTIEKDRLDAEIEMCRDLIDTQQEISDWDKNTAGEETKLPKLTLARLLHRKGGHEEEVLALYDQLIQTDPGRAVYYSDMRTKIH